MNKCKIIVAVLVAAATIGAFARPGGGGGRGCGGGGGRGCGGGGFRPAPCRPCPAPCRPCRPCPPPPPPHHYHGGGYWGRGGCNFWPGFVGGVVGGAIASAVVSEPTVVVTQPAVVTQPVVVTQPTVVTQPVAAQPVAVTENVWVEGRYVDQVQANGTVVRTWQPGHYEQRTVMR